MQSEVLAKRSSKFIIEFVKTFLILNVDFKYNFISLRTFLDWCVRISALMITLKTAILGLKHSREAY